MASCGGYDFLHIELIPAHIPFFISCQSLFWDGNTPHCSKRNASTMDKTIRQGVRMPKATWLFCFGKPAALFWCVPSVLVSALRQANTGYSHDNEINSLQSRDYEEDGERLVKSHGLLYSFLCFSFPNCDSLINICKSRALLNSERRKETHS